MDSSSWESGGELVRVACVTVQYKMPDTLQKNEQHKRYTEISGGGMLSLGSFLSPMLTLLIVWNTPFLTYEIQPGP